MAYVKYPSLFVVLSLLQGFTSIHAFGSTSSSHRRTSIATNPRTAAAFASRSSRTTTSSLKASTIDDENIDPYTSPRLDVDALTKYAAAAAIELSLFAGTFKLVDFALASTDLSVSSLPFPLVAFVFYAISLKSRVFNPLNNQRPDRQKAMEGSGDNEKDGESSSAGFRDRVMPSWTPPGVVFPIMWVLIIGPIRAYSTALVVSATGSFFSLPVMALILHLTIGDVWNTINNSEKRYGASVVGVACVVASAANAANQYYGVDEMAGMLLGGTLLWLVTASALIADTWRLNPVDEMGTRAPLFPAVGEAKTSFVWFGQGEEEE